MILHISIHSDVSLTLDVLFQRPLPLLLASESIGPEILRPAQARIRAISGYCDAAHGLGWMLYNLEAGVKSVYHVKHFTVCGQKGAIASPPHLTISCPVELLWSLEMSVGDDLETIKSDSDDALGKHNLIPAPGHVSPPPPSGDQMSL